MVYQPCCKQRRETGDNREQRQRLVLQLTTSEETTEYPVARLELTIVETAHGGRVLLYLRKYTLYRTCRFLFEAPTSERQTLSFCRQTIRLRRPHQHFKYLHHRWVLPRICAIISLHPSARDSSAA